MDQYRSRLKLSENFERHWSILISGEIHIDQSLVHTFSWGNSYGPMVLKVFLKFPPTLALVHGWLFPDLSHTPSTAEEIPENSGNTPEKLSELFLEMHSRARLGSPKPYNSRLLKHFQTISRIVSLSVGWGRLFFQKWFRRRPLRAGHAIPSSTEGISENRLVN